MPDFTIVAGETFPVFNDTLRYSDGTLAEPDSVTFEMRAPTAAAPLVLKGEAKVVSKPAGTVSYSPDALDTAVPGSYMANWIATFGGKPMTFPTTGCLWVLVVPSLASVAATSSLTDLPAVRQGMQKSVSDKLQDVDLEVLIAQASAAIQRYCNREFAPVSSKVLRSFEWEPNTQATVNSGLELIDLKPYEYRAIQTVTLDPDLEPVALSAVQYRQWPFPSRDGTFFGLRLTNLPEPKLPSTFPSSPALPFLTRRIDVTADWGMASIPPEVTHWANVTVEAWVHLRREGQAPAEGLGEMALPPSYDLPLPVKWGLRRWVRPTPAA